MNNTKNLLERALPFLHDEAAKYEDDGSNEPLELAREIEAALSAGAAPEGEAVAWAVRDHSDGDLWCFGMDREHAERTAEACDDELVPLYTRPQPAEAAPVAPAFDARSEAFNLGDTIMDLVADGHDDMEGRIREAIRDSLCNGQPATPPTEAASRGGAVVDENPRRFVVLKAAGSRYAYVQDTLSSRTIQRYDVLKSDGWKCADKHAECLNRIETDAALNAGQSGAAGESGEKKGERHG